MRKGADKIRAEQAKRAGDGQNASSLISFFFTTVFNIFDLASCDLQFYSLEASKLELNQTDDFTDFPIGSDLSHDLYTVTTHRSLKQFLEANFGKEL